MYKYVPIEDTPGVVARACKGARSAEKEGLSRTPLLPLLGYRGKKSIGYYTQPRVNRYKHPPPPSDRRDIWDATARYTAAR